MRLGIRHAGEDEEEGDEDNAPAPAPPPMPWQEYDERPELPGLGYRLNPILQLLHPLIGAKEAHTMHIATLIDTLGLLLLVTGCRFAAKL